MRVTMPEKIEWCFDAGGNPYRAECEQATMFPRGPVFCNFCCNIVKTDRFVGQVVKCPMCEKEGFLHHISHHSFTYQIGLPEEVA
jgi:hypothetical protein